MTPLNGLSLAILLLAVTLILALPRRWAPLPLLLGTFYLTLGQGVEVGPFNLFSIRVLLVAGLVRVVMRSERVSGGLVGLDKLMIAWCAWAVACTVFRADPPTALKANLGIAVNAGASYYLLRTFCSSIDDVRRLCAIAIFLLAPVALEMYIEQLTAHNIFSALGGVAESPQVREGRLRASGPFAHAILAGTIGAVCAPLAIALWRTSRLLSITGIVACVSMIIASASSGPAASGAFAMLALMAWRLRLHMRGVRWISFAGLAALAASMQAPVYYLIARIDIAGGSTGWYRARLIESASEHLDEWWLAGTDFTRHWMATGIDDEHADIANQYLFMGVSGGLVLMLLFMAILVTAFRYVGAAVRAPGSGGEQFLAWALGASLFAHATTFISVAYFDQSFVSLYLTLAMIVAAGSPAALKARAEQPAGAGRLPVRPLVSIRPPRTFPTFDA